MTADYKPADNLLRLALSIVVVTAMQTAAHAQGVPSSAGINPFACGDLAPPGQFGPFDYRVAPPNVRHIVEDYHFPPKVEMLIQGGGTGAIGADIDYTLRAFPNNPRALLSMSRLGQKERTERTKGARFLVECYFERAIRFQPNDPMPHLLYASYLKDRKRAASQIREQLDAAEQLRGDPANFDFDYNLGMLYYDVGAYDKSLDAAKRAYALGAPLPALLNKLKASGKWKE